MRFKLAALIALLVLAAGGVIWWRLSLSGISASTVATRAQTARNRAEVPVQVSADEAVDSVRNSTFARLAYAQAWYGELPPTMAAFREWTERYCAAADRAARGALEAEGAALARARRPGMVDLIRTEPQRALAITVPAVIRQKLPRAVVNELESRVAGVGDFATSIQTQWPSEGRAVSNVRRSAIVGDKVYQAYTYGRRLAKPTKEATSLHGVALDGQLALHESPMRVLEAGETVASALSPNCPVSDLAVETNSTNVDAEAASIGVVEAQGRIWEFCGGMGMVEQFEERLLETENQVGSRIRPLVLGPRAAGTVSPAASEPNLWAIGLKKILIIRIDFTDLVGEPVSVPGAGDMIDGFVSPYFDEESYGKTSLVATVTQKVYRMPRTAASYEINPNGIDLPRDAQNVASTDYTLLDYDRVMVVHKSIPGGTRYTGGEGDILGRGTRIAVNPVTGAGGQGSYAHELGHNYGMAHENLWQVTDGNPVSAAGLNSEYGDPFGIMGTQGGNGRLGTIDHRFHSNAYWKNRLGWLPDTAVTTVTASGTYRIYRFDSKSATFDHAQAIRIFRGGQQWYWIGLRQNFPTVPTLANGAFVVWGYDDGHGSNLLDLTTPGNDALDAGLSVGATLEDHDFGISIQTLARGGTEPNQYLDVKITLTGPEIRTVAGWGATKPASVPTGLNRIAAIAAGTQHALALTYDGHVVAWGDDSVGQTDVPAGLVDVTSIAAGGNVSGAVKRDGTVVIWGDKASGASTPPAILANVSSLAIAPNYALAIAYSGAITGWGSSAAGALRLAGSSYTNASISASDETSYVVSTRGNIVAYGTATSNVPAGLTIPGTSTVFSVAAGARHALALKRDGTVEAWGDNSSGQATVPTGLAGVIAIAAGGDHSLALKADGTVVAWGKNSVGQIAIPPGLKALSIAAGGDVSLAITAPRITFSAQPVSQTGAIGGTVVLSVLATGLAPLSYQWRKNGEVIANATSATLTLANAQANDAADYDVIVRDGASAMLSSSAHLTTVAIALRVQPQAQTVLVGNSVTFSVTADGRGPFTYLWRKNGAEILGATAAAFTLGSTQLGDAGNYDVIVRDGVTSVTSSSAHLTAVSLSIRTQPQSQSVVNGGSVSFDVSVDGADALSYQWRKSGVAITGATGLRFTLTNVQATDAGDYDVVIGAGGLSLLSVSARLTVLPVVAHIGNLSIRTNAGTGAQTLIVGFVVGGAGTLGSKPLLIRGVGPTLSAFRVDGALADPKLEVYNSANVKVQENDNWSGDASVAAISSQLGAFALGGPASKDAALYTNPPLISGSYSVQLSGVGGTAGVALAEIYDASIEGMNFTQATPRLINVSARTTSGTGADVLIAGFSISGPTGLAKKVLIRGIGPTLTVFGVSSALVDPKLELFNSASVKIQENDNWGGTAQLGDAFTAVGAFNLDSASKDAALLATLAPGSYTVQVSGVGGATGVALVEIYEIP